MYAGVSSDESGPSSDGNAGSKLMRHQALRQQSGQGWRRRSQSPVTVLLAVIVGGGNIDAARAG